MFLKFVDGGNAEYDLIATREKEVPLIDRMDILRNAKIDTVPVCSGAQGGITSPSHKLRKSHKLGQKMCLPLL